MSYQHPQQPGQPAYNPYGNNAYAQPPRQSASPGPAPVAYNAANLGTIGGGPMPTYQQPAQQFAPATMNYSAGAGTGYEQPQWLPPPTAPAGGGYDQSAQWQQPQAGQPAGGRNMPPPQQQQQQQQGAPGFGFIQGSGDMLGIPGANMLAANALAYGYGRFNQEKGTWLQLLQLHRLKGYFHVNNSYVINKLRIILFPILHKKWKREEESMQDPTLPKLYKTPRDDINAPDLYIPTMAFITYILCMTFALGLYHRFSPEQVGITASSALVTLFLELMIMKLGFYLLADSLISPPLLDLMAYSSYKYVGLIIDILVGVAFGGTAFMVCCGVTAFMMGIFMIRTLRGAASPLIHASSSGGAGKDYLFIIFGFLQILFSLFLVRRTFPPSETVASS